MKTATTIDDLRLQIIQWKSTGLRVAFVPTMGNLHQGHLSLLTTAQSLADKVVVSVFVNPLQFDQPNDLSAYPRTLEADTKKLDSAGCDLIFTPTAATIYPNGMNEQTVITVPNMNDKLCGKARLGHFDGVATVVTKLFNIVQPDVAVFGEKDYQQLLLIKKIVTDLNLPIEIVGAPTYREQNGLAMSSRNQYLTPAEKELSVALHHHLVLIKNKLESGDQDFIMLEKNGLKALTVLGFDVDYLDIRCADDLKKADKADRSLRILVAARLGSTRLIDNMACNL